LPAPSRRWSIAGVTRQVVVLGGGAGGATVVERLRERLGDADGVVAVDAAPERVPGLSLPWVLRGWRTPDEVGVAPAALRAGDVLEAEVRSILPGERRVLTTAGELRGDALVVALGATPAFERLPGLPEALASGAAGSSPRWRARRRCTGASGRSTPAASSCW
jgi:sulfide:quinone oxidoreductase